MKLYKLAFWKIVNEHFVNNHHQMCCCYFAAFLFLYFLLKEGRITLFWFKTVFTSICWCLFAKFSLTVFLIKKVKILKCPITFGFVLLVCDSLQSKRKQLQNSKRFFFDTLPHRYFPEKIMHREKNIPPPSTTNR